VFSFHTNRHHSPERVCLFVHFALGSRLRAADFLSYIVRLSHATPDLFVMYQCRVQYH
jgi:hypothetical protein